MHKILLSLLTTLLLLSCTTRQADRETLCVSIPPLRHLVREIIGDDFAVEVLVPPGASPETFEPTPRQMVALERTALIFNVGLIDFEQNLLRRIPNGERIVDLSRDIETLAGTCSHCSHAHAHGTDPHIWTSPRALRRMAANAYEAIRLRWPDSAKYAQAYERLDARLADLDHRTAQKIADSGVGMFIVYHPALTYYARDYGIEQLAIEQDGKEPSARQLARLISRARETGITEILYQSQFPASTVEVIAEDIGARAEQIDPLAEDIEAEIERITELITRRK